jgi:hypothetical protein
MQAGTSYSVQTSSFPVPPNLRTGFTWFMEITSYFQKARNAHNTTAPHRFNFKTRTEKSDYNNVSATII